MNFKIKRSTITGRPFRTGKKFTEEQIAAQVKFIREHPRLTNSQLAGSLSVSGSYILALANKHNLEYFSKTTKTRKTKWYKKDRVVKEGMFDDSVSAY